MTETTEEIIGAGYQTIDPEKGTIAVGPVNPNEKRPSLKDKVSDAMNKSGTRGILETFRYMFGMQKSSFTTEEQKKLDDMKERQGKTVGSPSKAENFKKTQEANVARATTPPKPWQLDSK